MQTYERRKQITKVIPQGLEISMRLKGSRCYSTPKNIAYS